MASVTSAFQGVTTPVSDLYAEIHSRGWTVTKLDTKDGTYVATVKNPHGDSVDKTGRNAQTALAAALMYIVRREFIRQGAWTQHWGDQLEPIAQAYAKAPTFDPKAAGGWAELAADSEARAKAISQQLQVEIVDDPVPYTSPQELWKDVEKNKKIKLTRADADQHPLWNEDQVLNYRLVHNVLGHAAAGGDFGWTGENLATAAHMPYLSPSAQAALFSEAIGQSAYRNYYQGHGPQKVTFLNQYLTPAQEENNPPGHAGEPVENSLTPGPLPMGRQANDLEQPACPSCGADDLRANPNGTWCGTCWAQHDHAYNRIPSPWDEQGLERQFDTPSTEHPLGKTAGVKRDPNYKYNTGIIPPAVNAVASFGDPLDHMGVKEVAHKLNTNWSQFTDHDGRPDVEHMKQTVVNAFRAALLSPKKELRWNAAHYQDLMHIPYHVQDPKVYWHALESARVHHNRSVGVESPEIAHKAHYESLLEFYRYYAKHHPYMAPSQVKEHADREITVMQAEIEERLINEAKDGPLEVFEPKVFKELDKRLKAIIKDDTSMYIAATSVAPQAPTDPLTEATTDRYGGFMVRPLISLARIGQHADFLTEAALADVRDHDGGGHHFREAALSLQIPYVGPKIVSFVWLLLQPMTSQLATIDTHMTDLLGYKQADVSAPRDYFRLERELQAGRDAAGYSHVPLGQFQWGMWDMKRNGEGNHQDHSALRPYQPQHHTTIDWKATTPGRPVKGEEYMPPEWWAITEPYRQNEVAKWNIDVAPFYPKNTIPWYDGPARVPHIATLQTPQQAQGLTLYHGSEIEPQQVMREGLRPGPAYMEDDVERDNLESEMPHGLFWTTHPAEAYDYGHNVYKLKVPQHYPLYSFSGNGEFGSTHYTLPASVHPTHLEHYSYDPYVGLEPGQKMASLYYHTPGHITPDRISLHE